MLEQKILQSIEIDWTQRLDLIETLLSLWNVPLVRSTEIAPLVLPDVLHQFHKRLALSLHASNPQNHLVPLQQIRQEEAFLSFAFENQGVYEWAIPLDNSVDPSVWGRIRGAKEWINHETSLSLFLLQFVAVEMMFRSPFGASISWMKKASWHSIQRKMTIFPQMAWHWPIFPTTLWVKENALVLCCPYSEDEKDAFCFWSGAMHPQELVFLKPWIHERWEYVNLEDTPGEPSLMDTLWEVMDEK